MLLVTHSVPTVRQSPLAAATAHAGGHLHVQAETFLVETNSRVELFDLTDRIVAIVNRLGLREGLLNLAPLHTTCALFVNEYQSALAQDIARFMERAVDRDADWRHNDPAYSDCDRQNADAHLRAMLLGHGLTVQISGGELALGQWQRLLLAEFDGPRARLIRLQAWGLANPTPLSI